jgi:hypothetical protein
MEQSKVKTNVIQKFFDRIFPKSPNFFVLLHQQCKQVTVVVDDLKDFLNQPDGALDNKLNQSEHQADIIRINNLQALNQAFSTFIDREDIYRAIDSMDAIVTHCKNTFYEVNAIEIIPDKTSAEMLVYIREGVQSLEQGFALLAKNTAKAQYHALNARHANRKVEHFYYQALGHLFNKYKEPDYLYILKMKEFYLHLKHISERVKNCANVLEDIIVKTS